LIQKAGKHRDVCLPFVKGNIMSENERTKRIKYFLKQKFNRNDFDYKLQLQEEVSCGEYHRNRCDLAGIEYVNGKIHNSIGIEIKQQLGDFKSGYGMNFYFDVNYLCVPSEFVGFAFQYLFEQNLDNVGIIEYRNKPTYYSEDLMIVKIPCYNNGYGVKGRSNCIMEKNTHKTLLVTPRSTYSINSI